MKPRRLLDSCILASTVTSRMPVDLVNALCLPAWIAPTRDEKIAALLSMPAVVPPRSP